MLGNSYRYVNIKNQALFFIKIYIKCVRDVVTQLWDAKRFRKRRSSNLYVTKNTFLINFVRGNVAKGRCLFWSRNFGKRAQHALNSFPLTPKYFSIFFILILLYRKKSLSYKGFYTQPNIHTYVANIYLQL
jgi:hypothetical protein